MHFHQNNTFPKTNETSDNAHHNTCTDYPPITAQCIYRVATIPTSFQPHCTIERCGCDFKAAQLVSPLLYQPWLTLDTMLHAEMPKPDAFRSSAYHCQRFNIYMLSSDSPACENIPVSPRPGRGSRIIISSLFLRQAESRKYPHLNTPAVMLTRCTYTWQCG